MSDIEAFIVRGHKKIIGHYRQLRDAAESEAERFQRRMDHEEELLGRFSEQVRAGRLAA